MKARFSRNFYIPTGALEIKPDGPIKAVAYLYHKDGKCYALAFSGDRSPPDWHYRFKTEADARARIAKHFEGRALTEQAKAQRRAYVLEQRCHSIEDVWQKARKEGYISTPDTAILVRAALAKAFPEFKGFSVRGDGSSVDVRWTDGPKWKAVRDVTERYSFGGFDGMIDLAYSVSRWLSSDGRISLAHSPGTEGSRGSDPEQIGDPLDGSAVLVRGGAKYVLCQREISDEVTRRLIDDVCKDYGITPPAPDANMHLFANTTRIDSGELICSVIQRRESAENEETI